jgi:ubiquinone biosynthesis protein
MAAAVPSIGELLTGWRLVTSLLGVVAIAFVAGRLLGTRRSLGATLLSAVIGWTSGATLAIVLARNHEHGDAGFTRNLWLFTTFFTMSASVWLEMLAKPGALARAQRSLAVPHPLRAMRRRAQRVRRYAQISRILARHGLGRLLGIADDTGSEDSDPMAVRVRHALEECGGMFVKMGQILSTRSDLLPPSVIRELSRLQDHVAAAPREDVETLLEADLGAPVGQVFTEFDWAPLAAASIGQVYRARLRGGEQVIVKVQRPGIDESVERDLDVLDRFARAVEARAPWAAEYRVVDLVREFASRLREELDFRIEASNATEIGAQLVGNPNITAPRIFHEHTTARVLVMEWFDGVSVRQTDRFDAVGADRAKLADALLRTALQQMLVDGHFHSDPHPGNVLLSKDGRLALIDFGATGRLDALEQSALREIMFAIGRRDAGMLRQAVLDVSTVRRGFDDDQFERGIARFMARYLGPGSTPNAAMLNELLALFFQFGIALPPEFSTFFRALVTLEGTLTTICPGYLVIDAAQDVAKEWVEERPLPATVEAFARDEVVRMAPMLRRLPYRIDRLTTMAERGDLSARISLFSMPDDVRVLTMLVNRVLLTFVGAGVGIISVILIGIKGGPDFAGQTSLYEFFGYFGLFCSTVLIMRVLVAIFRDGAT